MAVLAALTQLDRVPGFYPGCRGFESLTPRQVSGPLNPVQPSR